MAEQNRIYSRNSISGLTSILSHTILAKGSSIPMPKHQVTKVGNKRHGGRGRNILNLDTIWRFSVSQVELLVPIKQEKNCISQHFGLGSKEMNIHLLRNKHLSSNMQSIISPSEHKYSHKYMKRKCPSELIKKF